MVNEQHDLCRSRQRKECVLRDVDQSVDDETRGKIMAMVDYVPELMAGDQVLGSRNGGSQKHGRGHGDRVHERR